jgi:putative ABC transport system permease protein
MLKNYFKTAFRSLLKNKAFTAINIVGLAIGISAAMIIYLIVQYDFSFDKQHPDGDRIYRVVTYSRSLGDENFNSGVTGMLGPAAKNGVTGIEVVAPFYEYGYDVKVSIPKGSVTPRDIGRQNQMVVTDGSYFELLKFKWLAGSRAQAFKDPYRVVLTAKQAKIYFPGMSYDQMMGRQVVYEDTITTTVSGIVQELQQHTDFNFHDFISLATAEADKNLLPDYSEPNWGSTSSSNQLFIKVNANASLAGIKKQLNDLYKKNHESNSSNKGDIHEFNLQPLSDLHFNKNYDNFDQRLANKTVLYSLLGVAAFLLILGCINFVNLTTAQSVQRAKEIGVRKTIGGTRAQLIGQFLTETFLLTLTATLVSGLLAYYLLKLFSNFIPPEVNFSMMLTGEMAAFLVLLIMVITLASGLYPALMLSSYQPVQIMKGYDKTGNSNAHYLRKFLTVTQFVIAQFFVMATLLVGSQISYILHKDLGFSKDAILFISTPYKLVDTKKQYVYLNKLKAYPQVAQTSLGTSPPSSGNTSSTSMQYKEGKKNIETQVYLKYGDENYMSLYKLRLLAGRALQAHDTSGAFVINQTYAKQLGFRTPKNAVGKTLLYNEKKIAIIGVVQDFHQQSLHVNINPVAIINSGRLRDNRVIHVALKPKNGNNWTTALNQMEKDWKEIYPEDDFTYRFMDDSVARFYKAEQDTAKLLNWATGLSILISCLGLLGLAIHSTNQRTKEIGVRKVLGATVSQIVALLSVDFVKLIVLAFVVSLPVAWYAMHQWLQRFEYHTNISLWIFAAAIISTVMVALFTMSLQTVKAALANPVKSLRSE